MQFTTTTILPLLLTLTSASPTPHHETACVPKRSYPVSHPSGGSPYNINPVNRPQFGSFITPEIGFVIPEGTPATGPCSLIAAFPKNYEVVDTSVGNGGQPLLLNFFALDGPASGSLVGTTRLPTFLPSQKTKEDVEIVINSFACRPYQAFRIELGETGEVGFLTGEEGGLFLEYGC
ncbi:hypothetical protein QBC38DRAFT_484441 [Podospora fimiseda]|uniref:Ubiquitin 3 binding protein But2 C-terminal domain-containing protein n=1 Tax=Podospora fimiseda TaxID=252190 RepID=A0AAN7BJZ9_9PEZI|nr:hypothetical protein QBC38DRAFT_484441 [Podospora fimiseda]